LFGPKPLKVQPPGQIKQAGGIAEVPAGLYHMKKLPNIAKSKQPKVTKATKNPPSFYHLFRHHLSQTEEIHQAFGSTTPGHHIIQLCQDFQVGPMVNWV
jgi:hypothetical protein